MPFPPVRIADHQLAIAECEENIRVHAQAPHRRVRIVVFAACTALAARVALHLIWSFLNSTTGAGFLRLVLAVPLLLFGMVCAGGLLNELMTTNLVFERNTIEVERRLLGVRLVHRWIALADIRIFGPTVDTRHSSAPGYLYVRLYSGKILALLRAVNPASVVHLCAALERRGWSYGDDPPDG